MKTNKSKYQELIQGLFGFGPPSWAPLQSIAIFIRCYKLPLHYRVEKSESGVFVFFFRLLDKSVHPSVHLVVKQLYCSFSFH